MQGIMGVSMSYMCVAASLALVRLSLSLSYTVSCPLYSPLILGLLLFRSLASSAFLTGSA